MSTKTSIKRIALVAVSALGFGLMTSVAPANAAASLSLTSFVTTDTDGAAIEYKAADQAATMKGSVSRSGQTTVSLQVTKTDMSPQVELKLRFSEVADSCLAINTTYGAGDDADLVFSSDTDLTIAAASGSGAGQFEVINVDTITDCETAGDWAYTIFADADNDDVLDTGEATVSGTFVVGGAPETATVTLQRSTILVSDDIYMDFKLFDEDGNQTILDGDNGTFDIGDEAVKLTDDDDTSCIADADEALLTPTLLSTGTYRATGITGAAAAATCAEIALEYTADDSADPVEYAADALIGTIALATKAIGEAVSIAVVASDNIVETTESITAAAGGAAGTITVSTASPTVYFTIETAAASAYLDLDVAQGTPPASDLVAVTDHPFVSGTTSKAVYGVTNPTPEDGEKYTITITGATKAATYTVTYADPAPSITVTPSASFTTATGGTYNWTLTLKDQFGAALTGSLVASVTGRNPQTKVLTIASGASSFSFTDSSAETVTAKPSDAVTFTYTDAADADITATATVTITYTATATAVAKVAVTSSDDTPEIDTTEEDGYAAAGSVTTVTAVLTTSTGTRVGTGNVVTFTNSDLWFGPSTLIAGMTKGSGTAMTNSLGEATIKVYSRTTGTYQVSAKSASGTSGSSEQVTWANVDGDARYVALTSDLTTAVGGGYIRFVATVTDRWGNPISTGVDLTFSEDGVGRWATNADDTVTTGSTGTASIDLTANASESGSNTVSVRADTAAQTADLAGFVGAEATTGVTAGTRSASKTVTFTKDTSVSTADALLELAKAIGTGKEVEAAADAAAEAIDAANAATDAANLAAEAADAATVAAEEARDAADAATAAVEELSTQVATLMAALKAQLTTLANTVAKIAKKVKA